MTGTRTLIITASLPYPPTSGGAIRVYGILKGLYAAGHEITLLAFADAGERDAAAPLENYCHQIIIQPLPERTRSDRLRDLILSRQPDIARRLYSEVFASRLRELLHQQQFDLIQIEAIEVACYLPIVKAAQPGAKIVFDTFNAEYLLQRIIFQIDRQEWRRLPAALYSLIQAARIERFEGKMCQMADAVIAVSPEDADALRGFRSDRQITVVPSGIFVDDYTPGPESHAESAPTLVFTGKMDYRPNVDAMLWFADAILPLIQRQIPAVRLLIVGQKPHPRLEGLRNHPAVTLTGWVDSVQPYLHQADVYIAPLRMGSGTRLKLLEAMASGCAIVATTTAAAGMLDEARQAMVIADDAGAMADAVVGLLQNPAEGRRLGKNARLCVRTTYDWSVIIPRLTALYGELGLG